MLSILIKDYKDVLFECGATGGYAAFTVNCGYLKACMQKNSSVSLAAY